MRWTKPKAGTKRIQPAFAIIPIRIDDEMVWLERVYIRQELHHYTFMEYSYWWWEDLEYLTKEKVVKVKGKLCLRESLDSPPNASLQEC